MFRVCKPGIIIFAILATTIFVTTVFWHPGIQSTIQNKKDLTETVTDHQEYDEYSLNNFPSWDFTRLIDDNNFRFLIFNHVCTNESKLLIVVHSAPDNVEKRQAIRETWARHGLRGVHVMFIFGAVDTQEMQDLIQQEDNVYHDVIQGSFKDVYRNLPHKHATSLKFMVYYCPQLKYFIKVDDDSYVDVPGALSYLTYKINNCPYKDYLQCAIARIRITSRDKANKWYTTFDEYPLSTYPEYCLGSRPTIYSYRTVYKLYREIQRGEYFWIEDIYVTGIIAKRANISRISIDPYFISSVGDEDIQQNPQRKLFFGSFEMNPSMMRYIWNALNKTRHIRKISFNNDDC